MLISIFFIHKLSKEQCQEVLKLDKEILEILKSIQSDIKGLKEGQQRIEKKLDITYDQVVRTTDDITQ